MAIYSFKKEIPLVFAVDDNYAPFLCVALKSIAENASKDYDYKIFVLNTGLSLSTKRKLVKMAQSFSENFSLSCVDVGPRMDKLGGKTHLRDYYTNAIYYRIFIPSLFPQYEKILYIDCDVVLKGDIAELFNTDIGDNILGAVHEEAMSSYEVFGEYSEEFLDVPRMDYFNSGLLLINTAAYQKEEIENKFISLMQAHKFEVAPDQDYLNVVCKGRIKYLDIGWNKTPLPNKPFDDGQVKLVHYKMNFKPWHYDGIRYQDAFWEYAAGTPYYGQLLKMRETYSAEQKKNDAEAFLRLQQTAHAYINGKNNFKRLCALSLNRKVYQ